MPNTNGIIDIDHLMVRVASLDKAAEIYTRFGFFVCPPRKKISMSALKDGAAQPGDTKQATINNRHIIFKPFPGRSDVANFLEFMCIEDQRATPPTVTQMLCFLLDSEGPKTIVCLTDDVDRTADAFRSRGFTVPATIPFETGWDDEERDRFVRIQAKPFVPVFGQMPFQTNCYETSTLDNYQYTPWTSHPNTARYIAGVTGVTENLSRDVEFMARRVFDVEPEWVNDDVALVKPRDLFLRIVSPAGFSQLYPGLDFSKERILPHTVGATFAVESMQALEEILRENNISFVVTPSGICVPRQLACNTVLEFVPMQ